MFTGDAESPRKLEAQQGSRARKIHINAVMAYCRRDACAAVPLVTAHVWLPQRWWRWPQGTATLYV